MSQSNQVVVREDNIRLHYKLEKESSNYDKNAADHRVSWMILKLCVIDFIPLYGIIESGDGVKDAA
jgi:hypothetical protein